MGTETTILAAIILLPLLGALINGLFVGRLSRRVTEVIACGSVVLSFALSLKAFLMLLDKAPAERMIKGTLYTWFSAGTFHFDVGFLLDPLSGLMALIVTGVGSLIHIYSAGYMSHDPSYGRYFSYLNLFTFSMLALILGDNMLVMFLGWEGVGLCSYLLIGFWFTDVQKAKAGKKAFLVNRIGDLAFIIGMCLLLAVVDGSLNFLYLDTAISTRLLNVDPRLIKVVCLLFFIGATGKSAQIPLFVWLPDAMAGPTPVSALIHAATMVTAGVYMICRLNFLFVFAPEVLLLVAGIGSLTALFAASIGMVQTDIKKVLAYSTISQLGFMFLAVGMGAYVAAVFHLMTHAFFKACLFLGSGSVIHAVHDQDITKMGGLRKKMPITALTFLAATAAISGVPLLAGFFSKDEILWKAFTNVPSGTHTTFFGFVAAPETLSSLYMICGKVFFVLGVLAAFCTAFYMFRLYFLTFEGNFRGSDESWKKVHESPRSMTLALVVLAVLSVVGGWVQFPMFKIELLHHWLAPVFLKGEAGVAEVMSHSWEFFTMALSILIAGAGIGLAYMFYMGAWKDRPAAIARGWSRTYDLLWNKYWVDELYDAVIVRPYRVMAHVCHSFWDKFVIDTLFVRGAVTVTRSAGWMIRRFQTGDVQSYLALVVVGLAVMLFFHFLKGV